MSARTQRIITREPIRPDRVRRIGPDGFAFVPNRFLRDGFFAALGPTERELYFLLVVAADRNGLSFYHYDSICSLLQMELETYLHARNALIGIGPGSACTTRIKTGFGVPQLTAIKDCSRAGRSIVADGGIRYPGDIVKALAFGADFVMIGGMLAGTQPTPGNAVDGYKIYRGMASKEVADENGGLTEWKTAEGISFKVKFKDLEETDEILHDIFGGIRSGLTYSGSINIRELQRKLNYVEITQAGRIENTAHGELKC